MKWFDAVVAAGHNSVRRVPLAFCLVLVLSSCGDGDSEAWARRFFSENRASLESVKNFAYSCRGFAFANGTSSYGSKPPAPCDDGRSAQEVSPELKRMGISFVTFDGERRSGARFTLWVGKFGPYANIFYFQSPLSKDDIRGLDAIRLDEPCPCHWTFELMK